MQKIATRVFIYSSVAFGLIGILRVLTLPADGENTSDLDTIFLKLLLICVFIILPSFALSIAGRYLNVK